MADLCYCGNPIPPDGPTDLFCTQAHQAAWQGRGFDPIPTPARPEWRMGARVDPAADRPHQTPRIVPHPDGGVTQVWVDTPSDRLPGYQTGRVPAQENPASERAPGEVSRTGSPSSSPVQVHLGTDPLARPARTTTIPTETTNRPGMIRRILNARKAST